MKILLDENLPHKLRAAIVGHEVLTTAYMNWSGVENGQLLANAADAFFDVLITNDRGLEYEQNSSALPLSVIVLQSPADTIEAISPLASQHVAHASAAHPRRTPRA